MNALGQKPAVKEEINCFYCRSKISVFSRPDGTYECNQCHAQYLPLLLPGVKAERTVIQNWAIAEEDSAMGYIIVYGQKGDISRDDAEIILQSDAELRPGFTRLSPEFSELLWYSSNGTAMIDEDTIRDVCRKFAYAYQGKTFDGSMSALNPAEEMIIRVTFGRKIATKVDFVKLAENHKMIHSIPKSNDNLIRYFIAEGQEKLIVIAAQQAYDSFMKRKQPFWLGGQLCKAICA